MSVVLTGDPLTIGDVVAVARHGEAIEVGEKVAARMAPARALVDDVIARGDIVYGITTGFGALAQVHIEPERVVELQHAIVRSHAAGAGDPIDEEIVRGMMLLRARTLAAGHAGARPELVDRIVAMLNARITPVVPARGSVGASGDLAPLAHCALALIGEGEVFHHGDRMPSATALMMAGIEPNFRLAAKEGLALVNGTEGMLAMTCLAVHDFALLLTTADIVCAMTVQALLATIIGERSGKPVTSDDFAAIHFRLRGGALAAMTFSAVSSGPDEPASLTIHGERGAFRLTGEELLRAAPREPFQRIAGGELAKRPGNSPGGAFGTGTYCLGVALRRALDEGDRDTLAPAATFEDGLAQQRVLDAGRRSHTAGGRWEAV